MNIILLILGVIIIILSIVLITIDSSKTEEKVSKGSFEAYSPRPNIKNTQREIGENLFYEKIRDEVLESPIKTSNEIKEEKVKQDIPIQNTNIENIPYIPKKNDEQVDSKTEIDYTILYDSSKNLSVTQDEGNMTEKILEMKQQNMTNNEIAKSLGKGVREVEIILKINKINN